jgi:hypothetical protein
MNYTVIYSTHYSWNTDEEIEKLLFLLLVLSSLSARASVSWKIVTDGYQLCIRQTGQGLPCLYIVKYHKTPRNRDPEVAQKNPFGFAMVGIETLILPT